MYTRDRRLIFKGCLSFILVLAEMQERKPLYDGCFYIIHLQDGSHDNTRPHARFLLPVSGYHVPFYANFNNCIQEDYLSYWRWKSNNKLSKAITVIGEKKRRMMSTTGNWMKDYKTTYDVGRPIRNAYGYRHHFTALFSFKATNLPLATSGTTRESYDDYHVCLGYAKGASMQRVIQGDEFRLATRFKDCLPRIMMMTPYPIVVLTSLVVDQIQVSLLSLGTYMTYAIFSTL